jgi:hemerythrin-like metal-binding protein
LLAESLADGQPLSTSCRITEPSGSAVRVHLAGYPAGPRSPGVYTLLLHVDPASRTAPATPRLPAPVRRAFARSRNDILDQAGALLVDAWLTSESLALLAIGLHAPDAGWTAQARLQAETDLLERLRPCLREGDIIGRNGDDGLLVAIPNLSGAGSAGIVAGRLMQIAGAPGDGAAWPAAPEWNIGIALFPDDDQELSGLLTHAGAALEYARQCGANRYSLAETSLNLSLLPDPMPWDATLRTGLAEVDAQHSRVLDELRALSHDVGASTDIPALRAGLARIVQALVADFQREEALMAEHPGPGVDAHRREHDSALRNLGFLDYADARQGLALATQLLYRWLAEHVREHDLPLVASTFRPLW